MGKFVSEFKTEPVKRPEIMDRLAAFLPKIRNSTNEVECVEVESDESSGQHIELDLGLGVFDAPGAAVDSDTPILLDDTDTDTNGLISEVE